MNLKIVPRIVDTNTVEWWIGATGVPAGNVPAITFSVNGKLETAGNFDSLGRGVFVQRLPRAVLPGQSYDATASFADGTTANGHFEALPTELGDRANPFRVFFSSCFAVIQDEAPRLGQLYQFLAGKQLLRPHLNLWCGDQVYLDSPWKRYLFNRHTPAELDDRHLDHYVATWFGNGGLAAALPAAGNAFVSEDHELWNNAPFATGIAKDTDNKTGRDAWRRIAERYFNAFQTPSAATTLFDVSPLSFCLFDTRLHRLEDMTTLAVQADLDAVIAWIKKDDAPRVLVLGQPIFADAGKSSDFNLQNYGQFDQLITALMQAQGNVLVLSGDVHFTRIAASTATTGAKLAEIVCSPSSLVSTLAGGDWDPSPGRLRTTDGATIGNPITTNSNPKVTDNVGALLDFYRDGANVCVRVRIWPTKSKGGTYTPLFDSSTDPNGDIVI